MKRIVVVVILMIVPLLSASAGRFVFDAGAGVSYEFGDTIANESTEDFVGILNFLLGTLTRLRASVLLGFAVGDEDTTAAGLEIGAYAFASEDENGNMVLGWPPIVDLPARLYVRRSLGRFYYRFHAGYNFSSAIDIAAAGSMVYAHRLDVGVRFGGQLLYLEVDRLFWWPTSQSTRVNIGMSINDVFGSIGRRGEEVPEE